MASWSYLTNHALVLTHIGRRPDSTGIEIAQAVGITERSAYRILSDLVEAGYLSRKRVGRHNHYQLDSALRITAAEEAACLSKIGLAKRVHFFWTCFADLCACPCAVFSSSSHRLY